jgi:IS1 family transposase
MFLYRYSQNADIGPLSCLGSSELSGHDCRLAIHYVALLPQEKIGGPISKEDNSGENCNPNLGSRGRLSVSHGLFWLLLAVTMDGCGVFLVLHDKYVLGILLLLPVPFVTWRAMDYLLPLPCPNCSGEIRHSVPQKDLTVASYCGTIRAVRRPNLMANILPMEKKIAVISALAEGSGIRQVERMTGVNRNTIMTLGVRVGQGCSGLLDAKMRDLSCQYLQFDELWGFVGKKQRNLRISDDESRCGDVWTFCAIDSDTKLVPAFKVGKRNSATANAFVKDVAARMKTRVQVSTDALGAYVDAVEQGFGINADYGQVVKTYLHDESQHPERKYSAPEIVTTEKKAVSGLPDMALVSTSHVERLNGTTRLHMRRLTRLTYAFSKKLENFEAAVALHFAYYNFVKRHSTIRMTPAMAACIERDFWTVGDLIEAAA